MFWLAFYGLILSAWAAIFAMVRANPLADARDLPADFWQSLCIGAGQAGMLPLIAMWGVMAAAMMLPTFVPALRTFIDLGATGATTTKDAVALVGGYLGVWLVAAVGGAALQKGLVSLNLLDPFGASVSAALTAVLLIVAGAMQFSAVKSACLSKCRMPLTFFMEKWAPGPRAALRMGWQLGAICLVCCWALMLLGFVGGTMNLVWMGAATLFMTLEKLPEIGRYLTRPAGWILIAAGVFVALRAILLT